MKTRNVHRGGTVYRAISRKKYAALALCVSLWMAGGSVASAAENPVTVGSGETVHYVYNGEKTDTAPFDAAPAGEQSGWNTVIDGGRVTVDAYGGYSYSGGNANNNTVTIKNDGTVTSDVYGGYARIGNANENSVTLIGANVNSVWGGYSFATANPRTATHNTVSMTDSTAKRVFGGLAGGDRISGNTLNLYSETKSNTVSTCVTYFQTINIEKAKWGTPALTFSGGKGIIQDAFGGYATINTDGIAFSGVDALSAGQNTVLIKNIKYTINDESATTPGYPAEKIVSGKYKVGTTQEGTGEASIDDEDLIYTIKTVASREQTHNTVMGSEVGMAALLMGNDFIGAATEGLSLAANTGADGISSFAKLGGGSIRQETGSHVDVHTWNAILGLGHRNKKERGTFEYGAFFEYGTGNYTTHAENDIRGDGSARYTGGGLLAKYTMKNDVYVEGSLRAGSIHDDARDVMSDGAGNPYSYKTNAPYIGFHLGVGKEIALSDGNSVNVYGKYFYNHKNGVSFDAGGHYDLDAVTSSVLRVGARYTMKCEKWNFYGGLAYEHELDGKAGGTADGMKIRSADTSGASLRGELGATFKPEKEGPLTLDFNVSGFAGKKRGVTGGVSVSLMF